MLKPLVAILDKPYPVDPSWTPNQKIWTYVGTQVNLTCEGISEPPPKIEWFSNDQRAIKDKKKIYKTPYKSVLMVSDD